SGYYAGLLDEVRIWGGAPSYPALNDWMNFEITPQHPYYGLLRGYWRLNDGSGATAKDDSIFAKNGVLYGPTWRLGTPFGQFVDTYVNGLIPGTTYHYRIVATNDAGVTFGADKVFSTTGCRPPTITSAQVLTNGWFMLLVDATSSCSNSVYNSTNLVNWS